MSETLTWTEKPARWPPNEPSYRADGEGANWRAEFGIDRLLNGDWRLEADYELPCELHGWWSNSEDVTDVASAKVLAEKWASELAEIAAVLAGREE